MNESWNEIGASRRNVANVASRTSSSRPQKSHEPRLISVRGMSGGAAPLTRVAIPTPPRLGRLPAEQTQTHPIWRSLSESFGDRCEFASARAETVVALQGA